MQTDIQHLAAVVIAIEHIRQTMCPLPDDTMDRLTEAGDDALANMMAMSPTGMADVSAKMRAIAATNGNDESYDPLLPGRLAQIAAEFDGVRDTQFFLEVAA